jgi:hypothetical protein
MSCRNYFAKLVLFVNFAVCLFFFIAITGVPFAAELGSLPPGTIAEYEWYNRLKAIKPKIDIAESHKSIAKATYLSEENDPALTIMWQHVPFAGATFPMIIPLEYFIKPKSQIKLESVVGRLNQTGMNYDRYIENVIKKNIRPMF